MTAPLFVHPQSTSAVPTASRRSPRPGLVVAVLVLHVVALGLMQQNLERPARDVVTPVQVLQALVESVQPEPAAMPLPAGPMAVVEKEPPAPRPRPVKNPQTTDRATSTPATTERPPVPAQPAVSRTATAPQPDTIPTPPEASSTPLLSPSGASAGTARAGGEADSGAATSTNESKGQTNSTAGARGAPSQVVEQPVSNARHLNNAPPPYPLLSKRLGEQGSVVVLVRIGVNGTASQGSIERSSGFERLDQAALKTALEWRYVPGTRAGVPEAMWFRVPVTFNLR